MKKLILLIFLISCTKSTTNQRLVIEENCMGCHSLKLVEQNFMSREEWDKTLIWMEQKHNLPEFDPGTKKKSWII